MKYSGIKIALATLAVFGAGVSAAQAQSLFFSTMPAPAEEQVTTYSAIEPAAGNPHDVQATTYTAVNPSESSPVAELSEAQAQDRFWSIDRNKDGVITYDEYSSVYPVFYQTHMSAQPGIEGGLFAALDGDSDGRLSEAEFIATRNVYLTFGATPVVQNRNGARSFND